MRRPPNIYRRGTVYWFRRRLPAAGTAARELRLSLRTRCYRTAIARARLLNARLELRRAAMTDRTVDDLELSPEQVDWLLKAIAESSRETPARPRRPSIDDEAFDWETYCFPNTLDAASLKESDWHRELGLFIVTRLNEDEEMRACEGPRSDADAAAASADALEDARAFAADLARQSMDYVREYVFWFLVQRGYRVDPQMPRFRRFARDCQRALTPLYQINAHRELGDYAYEETVRWPHGLVGTAALPPAPDLTIHPGETPMPSRDPAPDEAAPVRATVADRTSAQAEAPTAIAAPVEKPAPRAVVQPAFAGLYDGSAARRATFTPEMLFSEAYDAMLAHKRKEGQLKGQGRRREDDARALVIEILGDKPLKDYTADQAFAFRDVIARLPSNRGKSPKERLTLDQEIARADRRDAELRAELEAACAAGRLSPAEAEEIFERKKVKRLSVKTVNDYLSYASHLFKHAANNGAAGLDNPFYRKRFSKELQRRDPGRFERMHDDEDLETLLLSPMFSGCKSAGRRSTRGDAIIQDDLYWIVLLLLFHGMRLEEAAQLRPGDIRIFFGVPWIVVHPHDGNSTKASASDRVIPVHRYLLELGFMKHVRRMRERDATRLFASLRRDKRGTLGGTISRRFGYYRRQIGLADRGRDLHALRHVFDTHLLNDEVPVVTAAELMGHARSDQTTGTYFKGTPPHKLWLAINRLTFGFEVVAHGRGKRFCKTAAGASHPAKAEVQELLRQSDLLDEDGRPSIPGAKRGASPRAQLPPPDPSLD